MERPKYGAMLAHHLLSRQIEKKLFRRKFIRLGPLLVTSGFLLETGAVLGRLFRDRPELFALPFFAKDEAALTEATDWMRDLGKEIAMVAADASTTFQVVMMSQIAGSGVQPSSGNWGLWLMSHSEERVAPEEAFNVGLLWAIRGAGFGIEFPKRFEDLYVRTYAKHDPESWSRAFKYGAVDLPEEPDALPIDEREQGTRAEFAEFCAMYYPDLLSPLGLA